MDKLAIKKNAAEGDPCQILKRQGKAPLIFLCDHASRHIPPAYRGLGLNDDLLSRHIAWDIGANALTERLSAALDAPALLARFSRLLIDPNRALTSPSLIPEVSDGIHIPGNHALSEAERDYRIRHFYAPFHRAAANLVRECQEKGAVPLVIGIHSFTPIMNEKARPWHVGLLWDKDPRLAGELISGLRARPGLVVGDNQPYTGRNLFHTMQVHGAAHGFPQVTIEVRQDELESLSGVTRWAEILTADLRRILKLPEMQEIMKF